jgi:hypothetical protein
MTVNKKNMGDIEELFNVVGRDSKLIYTKIMQPSGNLKDPNNELCLSKDEIYKFREVTQRL